MSRPGVIETVVVLVILGAAVHPGTTQQLETCYDDTMLSCEGNVVTGVTTPRECCFGDGFFFRVVGSNQCVQCIIPPTPQAPIRVNDTVIGDPLMTVPLNVGSSTRMLLGLDEGEHVSLCYGVHGEANKNFNLVSDTCVSVNAHYINVTARGCNIIDRIGVRAVDDDNQCHNIRADLHGCRAFVDGVEITLPYRMAGISVRRYPNRVRIAVPNCADLDLVMWVFCQNGTFEYSDTDTTFQSPMIRFVIARGFSLEERSHGILGQFWNIPIDVVRYNLPIDGTLRSDTYTITVNYPGQRRQFVGFLYPLTWEFDEGQCLYAGNGQGGPIDEVGNPNDPVLQGEYTDYIVDDLLGTDFEFAHFDNSRCSIPITTPPAITPAQHTPTTSPTTSGTKQ